MILSHDVMGTVIWRAKRVNQGLTVEPKDVLNCDRRT